MEYSVLDYGYVKRIECWGTGEAGRGSYPHDWDHECGIIEAARQSTSGSFRGWDTDQKLLSYLFNSNPQHATPFEFAGMVIEVQAPLFVFREWHRHRTQSYNEMSARYTPLPDLYYIPTLERIMLQGNSSNKQAGSTGRTIDELEAKEALSRIKNCYRTCESEYQTMLHDGVPKELARCVMPVGHYSRMRASANLRNWLAFLTLREDPHAQWEIRQFAKCVGELIRLSFPRTAELFYAHKL